MLVTTWPMSVQVLRRQSGTSVLRLVRGQKAKGNPNEPTSRRHFLECRARLPPRAVPWCLVWASAHQRTPVDPPLSVDNRCGFGRFCGEFAAFHTIDLCVFDRNYSTHARLSVPSAVFSLYRIDVDAMPAVKPHSPTPNRRLVDSLATPATGVSADLR